MARYFMLDDSVQEEIGDILGEMQVACEDFFKQLKGRSTPASAVMEAYFRARLQVMYMEDMEKRYPNIADSPIFQSVHSDMLGMLDNLTKEIKIA